CRLDQDHSAGPGTQQRLWLWRPERGCAESQHRGCGRAQQLVARRRVVPHPRRRQQLEPDLDHQLGEFLAQRAGAALHDGLRLGGAMADLWRNTRDVRFLSVEQCAVSYADAKLGWMVDSLEIDPFD